MTQTATPPKRLSKVQWQTLISEQQNSTLRPGRYHLALTLTETEIKASHWPIAIKYFQHYGIFCLKIKDAINDSPGCFFRFDRSSCR